MDYYFCIFSVGPGQLNDKARLFNDLAQLQRKLSLTFRTEADAVYVTQVCISHK
jgi:hypothetical protein